MGGVIWLALALTGRADNWSYWGQVSVPEMRFGTAGAQLATDGTNFYYSTVLDGVYRASLADGNFTAMPLTGFPLWDATTNKGGFAVTQIAATPQGTVVLSGSPVNVTSNTVIFNPPGGAANSLPVFYWWDETNQLWQAASISGKPYPYTGNVGNFSIAPDGSLWTCSGFASYAYRSTDGGKSYTAFDINARVPTNYFPLPLNPSMFTFGEVFSICAGWNNEVVIGTETGGYLHTTNNGVTWVSLDPNFTDTNSLNPLGHIGDARVAGLDHFGNFLCGSFMLGSCPAVTNWGNVRLIGWRPGDQSLFNAASGFPTNWGPSRVLTPPSGVTFCYLNQNYLLEGGVYRAANGRNWTQFNQGSGLDTPFAPGITNAVAAGNCFTMVGNIMYIVSGNIIYSFDSTPPPVLNRPPVARAQNVNLWENTPTNITLSGSDADGDVLNYTVTVEPTRGFLSGTPPDLTYTPTNLAVGLDYFVFEVDDGMATSAPVVINLAIDTPTNTLSVIALTNPVAGQCLQGPTNLMLAVAVSDPDGIKAVNFYHDNVFLGAATNAPYRWVVTNLTAGDYVFSARAIDNLGARTWSAPVRVSVLSVAPILSLYPVNATNTAVSWPLELEGFYLESAPDVAGPWTLAPYAPWFDTHGQTVTVPVGDSQFFRLMRP